MEGVSAETQDLFLLWSSVVAIYFPTVFFHEVTKLCYSSNMGYENKVGEMRRAMPFSRRLRWVGPIVVVLPWLLHVIPQSHIIYAFLHYRSKEDGDTGEQQPCHFS